MCQPGTVRTIEGISVELQEALAELLGPTRTDRDESSETLIAAARETYSRRQVNTEAGGRVLLELHDRGMSWREISRVTGIPYRTAYRWAEPPERQGDPWDIPEEGQ